MPYQLPKSCNYGGCRSTAVDGSSYCELHKDFQKQERTVYDKFRNRTSEDRKFYNSSLWKNLSAAVRRNNILCQAIENGAQCNSFSEVVHHLISPKENWELRIAETNLVAICKHHHNHSMGDSGDFQYVPTIGCQGQVYAHDVAISDPSSTENLGCCTAVGSSAIDRALAMDDDDFGK